MKKLKTFRLHESLGDMFDSCLARFKLKRSAAFETLIEHFLKEQKSGGNLLGKLMVEQPTIPGMQKSNMKAYTVSLEDSIYTEFKSYTEKFGVGQMMEYLITYYLQLPDDEKLNIFFQ